MPLINSILQELDHEGQTTRRLFERINDSHLEYQPHPKSRALGALALHIAGVPGLIAELAMQDKIQAPNFADPVPASAQEIVNTHDESIAKAKRILNRVSDDVLMSSWTMMRGDQEIFSQPKIAVLRMIMLNHCYHHRGQLSVYLRELDVPLPSIYGPSADENPFA
jgi:uncharacterized damage-inducible protein DinB